MIVSTHISVEEGEATRMGIPAKSTRFYREAHDLLNSDDIAAEIDTYRWRNEHARTPLAQMQFNALTVSSSRVDR